MTERRRQELGEFLRMCRSRLEPAAVGLPLGGRRLKHGLRREEVAAVANVSLSWYTALEQGRDVRVSDEVLESIARALRLEPGQRRHLFQLARPSHEDGEPRPAPGLPPHLQAFIDEQSAAVSVMDRRWVSLYRNGVSRAVFGDEGNGQHALLRMFTSAELRALYPDWDAQAKRVLASFRASTGPYVDEEWYTELVNALSQASPEFAAWWPQHDVGEPNRGLVVLDHSTAGRLRFEHVEFRVEGTDLRMVVHLPADALTRERVRALRAAAALAAGGAAPTESTTGV